MATGWRPALASERFFVRVRQGSSQHGAIYDVVFAQHIIYLQRWSKLLSRRQASSRPKCGLTRPSANTWWNQMPWGVSLWRPVHHLCGRLGNRTSPSLYRQVKNMGDVVLIDASKLPGNRYWAKARTKDRPFSWGRENRRHLSFKGAYYIFHHRFLRWSQKNHSARANTLTSRSTMWTTVKNVVPDGLPF